MDEDRLVPWLHGVSLGGHVLGGGDDDVHAGQYS